MVRVHVGIQDATQTTGQTPSDAVCDCRRAGGRVGGMVVRHRVLLPSRPADGAACGPDRTGPARLEALGQHLVLGQRRVDVVRARARLPAVLAELDPQLLHLVVVEVLLHQVALPLHPSPDVRGNVGDHPGHEELHHEDDVLAGEGTQRVVRK